MFLPPEAAAKARRFGLGGEPQPQLREILKNPRVR
jgi:hypothetical protein